MPTVAKDGSCESLRIGALSVAYSSADEFAGLVCGLNSDSEDNEVRGNRAYQAYHGDWAGGRQT